MLGKDRKRFIALCDEATRDKNESIQELRKRLIECSPKRGEVLDDIERADVETQCGQIRELIKHDEGTLKRISGVRKQLADGWNGVCLFCKTTSVIDRIKAGHFVLICCPCQKKREHHAAGYGKSAPYNPRHSYV